jgi:hypothetical protein
MADEREIAPAREVLMCPHGIVIVVHCNECRTIWTQPGGEFTAAERVTLAEVVHRWVYRHPHMKPWTPALVDSLLDTLSKALRALSSAPGEREKEKTND